MKTPKAALVVLAVSMTLYLVVGLFFAPRGGNDATEQVDKESVVVSVADGKVQLLNAEDSLSFAVSMMVARDLPRAMEELGITSENIDLFVKGVCDAFPAGVSADEETYARGVVVGAAALEMLERAEEAIYQSDTTMRVKRGVFLEGLKAAAYGDGSTMSLNAAYNYYNERIFKGPSEEFIRRNSSRNGVETLANGVQVKIERNGKGVVAKGGNSVKCIYKATYPNGKVFDSSRGQAVELSLDQAVPGLAYVLTTYPAGTRCKVYIPWQLAYGKHGNEQVPPYSAIVYDLEIVGVAKK
jgi:FKBP-type peptidyl-prolyl cis-trans isomerase FklB